MNDQIAGWVQQTLDGDDNAYSSLVETYQTPVYNLCYRMLSDPQEAEDAAQETFWRAYQSLKTYDPQRSFITWLLSIAAHYCIDQQRKRRIPVFSLDILPEENIRDHSPTPESATSKNEEDLVIHELLQTLNHQDRAAIVLYYWYDLSCEEIGQALSLSVSAVKSRLHRARLELAQRWGTNQSTLIYPGSKRYDESPAF